MTGGGGLEMDTATGSSDLAWLLVQLFFITTFVAIGPTAFVSELAAEEGPAGQPVVVGLEDRGGGAAPLVLIAAGDLPPPPMERSLRGWLADACAARPGALTVQVRCPEEATHAWCRGELHGLLEAAPECVYQY